MTGASTLKAVEVMNPKRRDMARLEDDAEQRIAAALDKWRRDLTRGMTADNAPFIVARLRQRDVYQPFYDAIIAVLRDLALAGAGFGREQIEQAIYGTRKNVFDVVWDLVNAAAEAWARQFGGQLIRGITETTRQRVAATVADWTTNDEGLYALTQRLAEPNGPFGQSRARTIAVTETTRAYAEGNRAAWRESNVVTRRRWNTNVDEAVCPICGPLHNVVVGLEESYPGGLDGPPAHPNCRCWVTPVVPGAEERETGLEQFGLGPQGGQRPAAARPIPTRLQEKLEKIQWDIANWDKAEPWRYTEDEIRAGRASGIVYRDDVRYAARNNNDGTITVGPAYFKNKAPGNADATLFYHEAGHTVGDVVMGTEDGWLDILEPFRMDSGAPRSVNSYWQNPFGLSSRPEEILADAYAEIITVSDTYETKELADVMDMVKRAARRIGFPDKKLMRITYD